MNLNEYADHDGLGLAALIRRGEVSSSEVLEAAIARIEQHNPALNAVIRKRYDRARSEALQVSPEAPFAGVPFLLKDLIATIAGEPTGYGNRSLAALTMPQDSELVRRFRAAGLVIVGRTNTPEFGLTPYTEPQAFGPTRNPWSAAALARGLERRIGGGRGGAHGASGQRRRRRRLDPHPGVLLRPVRLQAQPRHDADRARVRRGLARLRDRTCAHPLGARQRGHARCDGRHRSGRALRGTALRAHVPRIRKHATRPPAHRIHQQAAARRTRGSSGLRRCRGIQCQAARVARTSGRGGGAAC